MIAPWLDPTATMTARNLRYEAHCRRAAALVNAGAVGTIWRGDHLDVLTEAEADHWKWHPLPMGWSIVAAVPVSGQEPA